jgi:hypothetical protein
MIMIDQSKRLSEPLRWTKAGRLGVITAAVSLLIAVAVLVAVVSTGGSKLGAGCIEVTFPSTLGAAAQHACGAKARGICANPAQNPALADKGALREACRKAGLPYG